MIARNDPPCLFARGGCIMRTERHEHGRTIIKTGDARIVRHAVAQAVRCERRAGRMTVRDVAPPLVLVENVMATPELPFPLLRGIVTAPYFTRGGEAITTAGYDARSALMLTLDHDLDVSVRAHPSPEQIVAALATIDDAAASVPDVAFQFIAPRGRVGTLLPGRGWRLQLFGQEAMTARSPSHDP